MVEEINPDAVAIAAQLDAERKQGNLRGFVNADTLKLYLTFDRPLHGMPILIKANIGTADKMSTTGNLGMLISIGNTNASSWIVCFVWCKDTS